MRYPIIITIDSMVAIAIILILKASIILIKQPMVISPLLSLQLQPFSSNLLPSSY
jgi:hypothetical protein